MIQIQVMRRIGFSSAIGRARPEISTLRRGEEARKALAYRYVLAVNPVTVENEEMLAGQESGFPGVGAAWTKLRHSLMMVHSAFILNCIPFRNQPRSDD